MGTPAHQHIVTVYNIRIHYALENKVSWLIQRIQPNKIDKQLTLFLPMLEQMFTYHCMQFDNSWVPAVY